MLTAEDLEQLAVLMHEKFCPLWRDRLQGVDYFEPSDAACGQYGNAHAAQMIETVEFKELAGLLGHI
ncbi:MULTISPECIES: hypothetical protein [Mycolicibacter]|uniref:Uncharacterized protein n=2 Tax=Mycolicibacter TaxID=1073531 RepID=A0ABU5XMP7_9MYCO|nr:MULTISPECIES: hypothetical protein [unclassified Mycolicibacter]MEB3023037.1 hypothetical protein [Mycolicibacter sp. MYC098]MEB3033547.1 hypothetical protein [Mycolicibacter sp. MYC340]